jgi:hypothetical protein
MDDTLRAELQQLRKGRMPDLEARRVQERAEDRRENRRFGIMMCGIVILGLGIIAALGWRIASVENAEYDRFMAGCMQDHKEYECTVMWRASSPAPPAIVPIPVPLNPGR